MSSQKLLALSYSSRTESTRPAKSLWHFPTLGARSRLVLARWGPRREKKQTERARRRRATKSTEAEPLSAGIRFLKQNNKIEHIYTYIHRYMFYRKGYSVQVLCSCAKGSSSSSSSFGLGDRQTSERERGRGKECRSTAMKMAVKSSRRKK